ncbi:DUF3304 domain-containing protein [Pseudomonas chlororaphis]|uniref:DUF3304 domain-containing protein n=1 Tax=Pseudomonas chlororaphis TaxID=587753 RepID=UPI0009C179BE|nr:DUF3304 domain-containing protein [Pseudomonas chlororaphis]
MLKLDLNSIKNSQPRRRAKIIAGAIILSISLALLYFYTQPRLPAAMITSENYTDRPIFSFWINDFWGGNLAAMGGGGIICCSNFEGSTAKVVWILDMTKKQKLQGAIEERHEKEITMPPRGKSDRYLHVRFDPEHNVRLGWSPDLFSPFEKRPLSKNTDEGHGNE